MEDISLIWLSFFLFFLIVFSAFFSSSEIGMMSLNRYRLRHLVSEKSAKAIRVKRLLKRPDRLLGVILIGNTFANIVASAIATIIAVRLFGNFGFIIATVLLTLVILIFAEIAPKTVAALHPMRVAFVVSRPLTWLQTLLYPFVFLANSTASGFLKLFGVKLEASDDVKLNREELRTMVIEAGSLIPSDHKKMLVSILDLEMVTVEDIMIPRNEIIGINLNEPWPEILEQLENSQHTRMPIWRDSIEHVEGMLHSRSIVNSMMDEELTKESLIEIAEPCYFVPEGTPLHLQLVNFKKEKQRSCFVVDEYGDIQGLVTLEDILEEIVGEFTTDMASVSRVVYPQTDGSYLVDAGASIREVNRLLDIKLPTDGPKTLSGLIIEYLEFIPSAGICARIGGYPIEIIQVKDNMIKTVRIDLR